MGGPRNAPRTIVLAHSGSVHFKVNYAFSSIGANFAVLHDVVWSPPVPDDEPGLRSAVV